MSPWGNSRCLEGSIYLSFPEAYEEGAYRKLPGISALDVLLGSSAGSREVLLTWKCCQTDLSKACSS